LAGLTEHAAGRIYKELADLAASEESDIYIGHYPIGLAAAARAAKRWNAKLGYDIEDLYSDQFTAGQSDVKEIERIEAIETRYLSRCDHASAVSPFVANRYVEKYGVRPPITLLNVFPLTERESIDGKSRDRKDKSLPSLYWYSQTIGEDRGIEDAICALGLIGGKADLHLRGSVSSEVERRLITLAKERGVGDHIYFHAPVSPTELLSRTAEHDIGLALEQPVCENRILTITNKIFFYFLAGIAVAATDTKGQRSVMESSPGTGFLYSPGDCEALAAGLLKLVEDRSLLQRTKQAALSMARERWNWESESKKLVESVSGLMPRRSLLSEMEISPA